MNPYEVLGVDKNATQEEIKKAYRKLSMVHHPDRGGDENKFKDISVAYDTLSNPEKKQQYDMFGESGGPFGGGNPFGSDGVFGFEEMINQMFGGGSRFNSQRQKRGSNVNVYVSMTLDEIIKGASKTINYTRHVKCDTCSGVGGEERITCTSCNGRGFSTRRMNTAYGIAETTVPCGVCEQSGFTIKNRCNVCAGSGVRLKSESTIITIPAGVSEGMQLNVNGGGNAIRNGVVDGDLILVIKEIPDPNFKRDGNNLIHEMKITVSEAVLGASKIINAPTGELRFNIEPGCQSGKIYNLNGKGVPNISQSGMNLGSGNLLIKINVVIPKVDDKNRHLFEQLQKIETT